MSGSPGDPPDVLGGIEQLRSRVRADRRETSVPLLALGVLVTLSSLVPTFVGGIVLAVVAALALLGMALYYQRRERRVGVGTSGHRWRAAGGWVLLAYLVVPWLAMLFLPPVTIVGVVVGVVGVRSGNRALIVGGGAAAAVSGLEQWFVLSNRFWGVAKLVEAGPHTWWVANAHQLVLATLAAALVTGGLVALRGERRRA